MSTARVDAPSPTAVDKELGETNRKKGERTTEIVMPTSWVDQALAKLAELKASVSILHNELSELIGSQVKTDQLLRQEAATYVMSKAEQKKGPRRHSVSDEPLDDLTLAENRPPSARRQARSYRLPCAGVADVGEAKALIAVVLDSHFQFINCIVRSDMFLGGNVRKQVVGSASLPHRKVERYLEKFTSMKASRRALACPPGLIMVGCFSDIVQAGPRRRHQQRSNGAMSLLEITSMPSLASSIWGCCPCAQRGGSSSAFARAPLRPHHCSCSWSCLGERSRRRLQGRLQL